jgi:hypothetical protein
MTTRSRTALVCVVCLALIGGVIEGSARTSDLSSLSIAISNAPTSSLPAGQPFTFTATAEGSTDPLEYSFWLLDAEGWTCVRTYDPSPSLEWTSSKPGNYALQAWSRRIGQSDPYEAWTSIGFDIVTAPLTIQLTTTSSFPHAVPGRMRRDFGRFTNSGSGDQAGGSYARSTFTGSTFDAR